jgi:hypothetical protein
MIGSADFSTEHAKPGELRSNAVRKSTGLLPRSAAVRHFADGHEGRAGAVTMSNPTDERAVSGGLARLFLGVIIFQHLSKRRSERLASREIFFALFAIGLAHFSCHDEKLLH